MIYRTKKLKNYTQIDNNIIKNKDLSCNAFKVLIYLLSFSDSWKFNKTKILNDLGFNEKKLDNVFKELKNNGYLETIKERKDDGTYEWTYNVYENPNLKDTTIPPKTTPWSKGVYNNTKVTSNKKLTESIDFYNEDNINLKNNNTNEYFNSGCKICKRHTTKLTNGICDKCYKEFDKQNKNNDIPF